MLIIGTSFGVTAAEVTEAETAIKAFDSDVEKGVSLNALKKEQSKKTKASDKAFVAIQRQLAKRIKASATYTEAVDERYKIVGDENSMHEDKAQPKLKARKVETGWELSFNLQGLFSAVKIFRKKPNEEKKFLAVDTSNPYIDSELMVNGTQYTAWYMRGDETVGKESDPVTVPV